MEVTDRQSNQAAILEMLAAPSPAPGEVARFTGEQLFVYDQKKMERAQLTVLNSRFSDLVDRIPHLQRLSRENRITTLGALNDVVPLLFPHTAYKAYPLALIDNCRFGELNKWLNDYTVYDLSSLDAADCLSLDDWLTLVEENTDVRAVTSSGTSGKLSIVPMGRLEDGYISSAFAATFSRFGDEPGLFDIFAKDVSLAFPYPVKAYNSTGRLVRSMVKYGLCGDESRMVSLGGGMSTDVMWMTGRLKKAQAEGTVGQLKKTKAYKVLSEKIALVDSTRGVTVERFMKDILVNLKGRTIVSLFGLSHCATMVEVAEKEKLEIEFGPSSILAVGGGAKGFTMSPELERKARKLPTHEIYGFGENISAGCARKCREGHYHWAPWLVSFVLSPETGEPAPRTGVHTGRYAAFNLWAQTFWGGFITGDEVTVNFDGGCGCGRSGPYLHGEISRYSDKNGGDDKITCQRTAAAVAEMVEHINAIET